MNAQTQTAKWLQAWDSQGTHRTGTAGDHAGADWIVAEARALGATVTEEPFALDRLDPGACYLQIGDTRIPGIPVFDAPVTQGVSGPLTGTNGIAVVSLAPSAVYTGEYRTLRQTAAHDALVIVCSGANPGLGLLNAEQFNHPYGAPAIHVDTGSVAPDGRMARLVSDSVRTPHQRPQHRRYPERHRSQPQIGRGHDPPQFLVAIDRRARRRHRVLAGNAPSATGLPARLRRHFDRQ